MFIFSSLVWNCAFPFAITERTNYAWILCVTWTFFCIVSVKKARNEFGALISFELVLKRESQGIRWTPEVTPQRFQDCCNDRSANSGAQKYRRRSKFVCNASVGSAQGAQRAVRSGQWAVSSEWAVAVGSGQQWARRAAAAEGSMSVQG